MSDTPIVLPDIRQHSKVGRTSYRDMRRVRRARTLYLSGERVAVIAQVVNRSESAVVQWAREYGWPARRRQAKRHPDHDKAPLVWRCPCDPRQLHKAGEACQCGHVPPWAEAS